jgi:tetratricopeptide (TPR) repeat protein
VTRQSGNHERATEISGQARDVFREQGERWGGALAAYGIGMGARATGRINEARGLFEQALVEVEAIEDRALGCFLRSVLGGTAFAQGDLDEARAFTEAAQSDAKVLGFRLVEARALHQLGAIAAAQGNPDHATQLLLKAETDYRDVGSWIDIAYCRNDLGYVRLSQGKTDEAMTLFEDAMAIARDRGDHIAIALLQVSLGDALAAEGNITGAAELYRVSLTAAHKLADRRMMANCLRGIASIAMADGLRRLSVSSPRRKRGAPQIASTSSVMPLNAARGIWTAQELHSARIRSPSHGTRAPGCDRMRPLPRR